jgi:hypothetical protein
MTKVECIIALLIYGCVMAVVFYVLWFIFDRKKP